MFKRLSELLDKRFAYIVVGLLLISYLVSRKAYPELPQLLRAKAVAIYTRKSASSGASEAPSLGDQWEQHRKEIFASRVAESQRRAVARYPALAVPHSEMNIRFVYRYQWMAKEDNARLHAPNWPELLADDCAKDSKVSPVAANATSTPPTAVPPSAKGATLAKSSAFHPPGAAAPPAPSIANVPQAP